MHRLLCPVLPPSFHLQGDEGGWSLSLPASARLHRLRTASLSGHAGLSQGAIWHSGRNRTTTTKKNTCLRELLKICSCLFMNLSLYFQTKPHLIILHNDAFIHTNKKLNQMKFKIKRILLVEKWGSALICFSTRFSGFMVQCRILYGS